MGWGRLDERRFDQRDGILDPGLAQLGEERILEGVLGQEVLTLTFNHQVDHGE